MKKTSTRLFLSFTLLLLFISLLVISASAAAGSGYSVNDSGAATNIKWTMTEDGVLTFEIDAAATDKVQTTELYGVDPVTGTKNNWNTNLPTFADAKKIIIGDGITAVAGFSALSKLQTVELAPSVNTIKRAAFEYGTSLSSVYIRGNEPSDGLFDFSNVTAVQSYCLDGCLKLTNLVLSPNYAGELPAECFKYNGLTEIELPTGVTTVNNGTFMYTSKLKTVTVLGMNTEFVSDEVFGGNKSFPAIKAKANSKAAEFAKANGYTFIDLDTGEETKGTKPTTGAPSPSGGPAVEPGLPEFKHEGATAWGHSSGQYNGSDIINTYWAYYADTKTLEFVSATTNYNETGSLKNVDKEYTDWSAYKDEIEHIIVGDYISKISGSSFQYYTALKDIRLGKNVNQIDGHAFLGSSSLSTIWRDGTERVEGRADMSGIKLLKNIFGGTAIKELVLHESIEQLVDIDIPNSLVTIYASKLSDSLIALAKEKLMNLINTNDPTDKYEFYVYVDPNLPACGSRSVFRFDEATGTLTIEGAGKIDDIINYYGGGSKTQPWFSIRDSVKHIVIGESITSIGKYAFCEFSNLESVQIPNAQSFEILNAAFEKCHNLKSVYRSGTDPIEGTADIRNVHDIYAWTFAYDYLIANVVVSPEVDKIGSSVFEENINLANIYGTPGSFAEEYAIEFEKNFFDISANSPQPITCIPPETTAAETVTEETETTFAPESTEETETTAEPETETTWESEEITVPETAPEKDDKDNLPSNAVLPIIIAAVAVAVVTAVVVILILKKKKADK
ncbi:MAG: leucine-rich repeat protein [Clostridia bacterium]|nr:leucine-rich repeat protein [Clostridia bacterium]